MSENKTQKVLLDPIVDNNPIALQVARKNLVSGSA